MTEEEQLQLIEEDWRNIKHIKNPSSELCIHALEQNVDAIYYMNNLSEGTQLDIVNFNPWLFSMLEDPTETVKIKAVERVPGIIRDIENPSQKIECESFLQMKKDEKDNDMRYFPKESLFLAFYLEDANMFSQRLNRYKNVLHEPPYFEGVLDYLILKQKDWVTSFIDNLLPLTKEQQEIWNKHRLKTLV